MAKKPTTGRASLFRGKADGVRVQGVLTKTGGHHFEQARRQLANLVQREAGAISDADVIEYLARGDALTRSYLKL